VKPWIFEGRREPYRPRVSDRRPLSPPGAFETRRLRLRRPRPDDDEAVFAYASDPVVTRLMDWPTHARVETSRRFLEFCADGWAAGTEFTWLVTLRPDDRALGAIACRPKGDAIEFGYVLHRAAHGRGLATEAARAVVGWLWCLPHVGRIEATCDVENAASARVLEKAGLALERVLPAYGARPNLGPEPRDAFLYAWVRGRD
jgi:RimJ/RimL family protein N-acetyltransferase